MKQQKVQIQKPSTAQSKSKSVGKQKPTLDKLSDRQLSKITEAFAYNRASNILFQSSFQERNWLKKHGKEDRIDFKDDEITKLRKYFTSLDGDGSGSIGLDELEDPLIALGLAQTREEVEKLINDVDDDESGQIEFKEFLSIMSSVNKNGNPTESGSEKSPIYDFFKS